MMEKDDDILAIRRTYPRIEAVINEVVEQNVQEGVIQIKTFVVV